MKNAINEQFKMTPGSKEVDTQGTFKMDAAVSNMGRPTNYGTPSGLNSGTPEKDEFGNVIPKGFKDSRSGKSKKEVGGKADSYETLEKKIVRAAKDDPARERISSSKGLRQTSRGNIQTSGMTQAERNRMERKASGIESATSRSGVVSTYERLKKLRKDRLSKTK